jgi:enoyl-CoA hydratase/carnithine racemase
MGQRDGYLGEPVKLEDLKFETIQVEKKGGVLNIWLNRPEVRNAFNALLHHELEEVALDYAEDDPDIKVIVVRGRGKIFSAGHDLVEVASGYATVGKPGGWDPHRRPGPAKTWYCSKPIIAGVHTYVGPIAWSFLSDIDFVIAAEGTRFSLEQARMGGGSAGGTMLLNHFPPKVWKQLIMIGGWMTAEQCKDYGFVARVVPQDQLDAEVDKWATEICKVPLAQLQASKQNVHRQFEAQGYLTTYMRNLESGHGGSEDMAWFKKVMDEGLKAALKERDAPFDDTVSQI